MALVDLIFPTPVTYHEGAVLCRQDNLIYAQVAHDANKEWKTRKLDTKKTPICLNAKAVNYMMYFLSTR